MKTWKKETKMQSGKDSSSITARRVPQNDDNSSFVIRNFSNSHSLKVSFPRSLKISLLILHLTFIILHSSIVNAIEVGGHITEDTTWSPNENPYLVTETLYVDPGVTLLIQPGTEIKVHGAQLTCLDDYYDNFFMSGGVTEAKYIQVDGRIIAEGTQQDSIIFTRIQDDYNYNWGVIAITQNADLCVFKHCIIEHMAKIPNIDLSGQANGLKFYNGKGSVRYCRFNGNAWCIDSISEEKELEIIGNKFGFYAGSNPYLVNFNHGKTFVYSGCQNPSENKDTLICGNYFSGMHTFMGSGGGQLSCAYNTYLNCRVTGGTIVHYYKNTFDSNNKAMDSGYLFARENVFLDCWDAIDIDYSTFEICDNYFENSDVWMGLYTFGKFANNKGFGSDFRLPGFVQVYNNISESSTNVGIEVSWRNVSCDNNIAVGNGFALGSGGTVLYNNCIFVLNDEVSNNGVSDNPTFRNCIVDFPLDPPLIDAGGNIIVDSLQAQSIFEDIQNGDFHLAPGSIAIDAGFDTLGYYYPFDLDYSHRVWDRDGDGSAIIDIGPYEYDSPAMGSIQGVTLNCSQGYPIDYVLIMIDNDPGDFTFSDSSGCFEYKLPEGVYDIFAERVFFEDTVQQQVIVYDGQVTQIDIPMYETVDVNEHLIPNSSFQISNLTNYPNPFNPTTTISFNVTQTTPFATIEIYNLKGQKVKTLPVILSDAQHCIEGSGTTNKYSVVWNGTDQNNQVVSSGIYFARLKAGNVEASCKMLLLK